MKYSESHEWIKVDQDIGTVGITDHAQRELGEVVYIELPAVGKKVRAGEEVAVLESTKAAADIYAPVSGEIIEINQHLNDFSEKINQTPETEGWLFKIKLSNPQELDGLIDWVRYLKLIT
jgi:glycine cleavage system H protein